ncbi:magnesium transporter CorA family protein [Paenibacillus sp. GYB004]|uniref:magnesium transporter CorA family protein n=1 Tax=Paenibacillus sp. GYB004 TaxID=2994393 RepID=UPI002F967F92
MSEPTSSQYSSPDSFADWQWVRRQLPPHKDDLFVTDTDTAAWIERLSQEDDNLTIVTATSGGLPVLYGTLRYKVDFGSKPAHPECPPLHFHVMKSRLITVIPASSGLDIRLEESPWAQRLERCRTAHEAFCVLLCSLVEPLHAALDGYEARLGELEQSMRERNRKRIVDRLLERRHELIRFGLALTPLREAGDAVRESFLDEPDELPECLRLSLKLERIERLLRKHENHIDTLLQMEEVVSSVRGNEIMKTLTIFTVLFTPATVIGALWGMNFDLLPFADWSSGFGAACAAVLVLTAVIYAWLWRKGWTGDLLRGRKAGSNV